jgi:hypothetical protein
MSVRNTPFTNSPNKGIQFRGSEELRHLKYLFHVDLRGLAGLKLIVNVVSYKGSIQ